MLGFPIRDAPNELFIGIARENDLQLHEMIALATLRFHPPATQPKNRAAI